MRRRRVLIAGVPAAIGAYGLTGRSDDESDRGRRERDSTERGHGTGSRPSDEDGPGEDDPDETEGSNEPGREEGEESVLEDSEGMVVFTYDDSPLEDYTLTYEVHREYGVPGCTAACPGHMEERNGYLDPAQLREMQDDGWGVLSHTYRHRALGHIGLTEPARKGDDRIYVQVNRHGAIEDDPLVIFDEETETTATAVGRGSDSSGEYVELAEPIAETVGQSGYVRYPGSFMREVLERTDDRLESWGLELTGFVYPYGRYDGLAEDVVRERYPAVANHRYGGGHNELAGLDPTAMRRMYVETDKTSEDEIDAFMRTAADEPVLAIVGAHSQYDTLTEERLRYTIEAALKHDLAIVTIEEALARLEAL